MMDSPCVIHHLFFYVQHEHDLKENLSFSYNFSNLLTDVRKGITQIATITYLADGTKVKVRAADGTALLYRGKFVYKAALNGLPTIESVEHDHGRFLPGNSANEFIDTWHVRDYLGSTRAVFDITPDYAEDLSEVILEQNDYCLFGSRIDNADLPTLAQNRFRFNGKEKLIAGANDTKLTDYGARMFSAPLARWTTPDPLADKYYSTSPYAFCNNNPVNFVDPDGKSWGKAAKVVKKVYKTAKAGGKISVKGILKSEIVDIVDNVHTILDSEASLFEKGIAAFDLATGFGDEVKGFAKAVGVSDSIVDGAKAFNGQSDTFSKTANKAFRNAKDQNGIPRSQQPDRTVKPYTEAGNTAGLKEENVVLYEFTNSKGEKITIRHDRATTYPDGGYQPPHYNAGKSDDNKLKQHHYYE